MKEQFDIEKQEREIKHIFLAGLVIACILGAVLATMWADKIDKLLP